MSLPALALSVLWLQPSSANRGGIERILEAGISRFGCQQEEHELCFLQQAETTAAAAAATSWEKTDRGFTLAAGSAKAPWGCNSSSREEKACLPIFSFHSLLVAVLCSEEIISKHTFGMGTARGQKEG